MRTELLPSSRPSPSTNISVTNNSSILRTRLRPLRSCCDSSSSSSRRRRQHQLQTSVAIVAACNSTFSLYRPICISYRRKFSRAHRTRRYWAAAVVTTIAQTDSTDLTQVPSGSALQNVSNNYLPTLYCCHARSPIENTCNNSSSLCERLQQLVRQQQRQYHHLGLLTDRNLHLRSKDRLEKSVEKKVRQELPMELASTRSELHRKNRWSPTPVLIERANRKVQQAQLGFRHRLRIGTVMLEAETSRQRYLSINNSNGHELIQSTMCCLSL